MRLLQELVTRAVDLSPDAPALRGPDGTLTYRELDELSHQIAHALAKRGVLPGDRVGLWGEKSCRLVATMQAVLRLGAAYVPVAVGMPASRTQAILEDCEVRCLVADRDRLEAVRSEKVKFTTLSVDDSSVLEQHAQEPLVYPDASCNDLAYVLYTSGSTGRPKGVCISHRNALAFVDWAAEAANISEHSRVANHAAFNFDLSVFDLYASFLKRACVSIVPEALSSSVVRLTEFIKREKITVWYSVPSALVLMIEEASILTQSTIQLQTVIFAGEVFPIGPLRKLRQAWPHVELWNFYGPTETNVCTAYKIDHIPPDRTTPVPIGLACCGDHVWLRDSDGNETLGPEGELVVEGPTVMLGYWGEEPLTGRPYATGDICRREADGHLAYVGRIDHMVKLHGYRVELGDVEAALAAYPGMVEIAVIVHGDGINARLVAFFVTRDSRLPTLIELKTHCAKRVPAYMLINTALPMDKLPRTPNGKVNRQRLGQIAQEFFDANASRIGDRSRPESGSRLKA
jgi:amino acid adenylation domain-containing protein